MNNNRDFFIPNLHLTSPLLKVQPIKTRITDLNTNKKICIAIKQQACPPRNGTCHTCGLKFKQIGLFTVAKKRFRYFRVNDLDL